MQGIDKDRVAFSWLTRAWDDYISALPLIAAVTLAQAAVAAGSFYIIHRTHSVLYSLPYIVLVITPFSVGANLVYIKIARGGGASFRDLFSAFHVYHRAVAVSVLLSLLTIGGAALLIIPGLIIYLTYMFSEYAVVDRRTGIKDSFLLSAAMVYGWRLRLLPLLTLTLTVSYLAPDIFTVTGPLSAPKAALDLKPWTVIAAALKSLVFLPWLSLAMARAYTFLLGLPLPEISAPDA